MDLIFAQRVRALFVAVGFSMLAAACGSGSSPDSASTPPPSSGTPPGDDYWLLGRAGESLGASPNAALVFVDPDTLSVHKMPVDIPAWPAYSDWAVTYDTVKQTLTYLKSSHQYYVKDHQLFQLGLRKSDAATAQRISSLTTVCSLSNIYPAHVGQVQQSWLELTEAGVDGDCSQTGDNPTAYVRTDTSAGAAPISLPSGVAIKGLLFTDSFDGAALFVALDARGINPKLTLYGPSFEPVGDVQGGAGVKSFDIVGFVPGPRLTTQAYVFADNQLRLLTWSATSASISAPLYTFVTSNVPYFSMLKDTTGNYFLDGLDIHRIDPSGKVTLVASLDPSLGKFVNFAGISPNHVLVYQSGTGSVSLLSVPKNGGPAIGMGSGETISVVGTYGDDIIYQVSLQKPLIFIERANANGTNRHQLASRATDVMQVIQPTQALDAGTHELTAVVWCEVAFNANSCKNGELKAYNLSSSAVISLGTLSHTYSDTPYSSFHLSGAAIDGNRLVIDASRDDTNSRLTDMYVVKPGVTGSLMRITTNIP